MRPILCLLLIAAAPLGILAESPRPSAKPRINKRIPPPTIANFRYGEHERQVLDFWQAESKTPTPVIFHIHGGGWLVGDKSQTGPIDWALKQGFSVVSINYRFTTQAGDLEPPVKAPLLDAARALQTVRSKAAEWNIDPVRIGGTGGSAGGFTCLWLAYHPDLAEPQSPDPIARQSTRLWCVAANAAQTTLDPQQMRAWIPNIQYGGYAFGCKADPAKQQSEFDVFLARREPLLPWIAEYSPFALVSPDDPPTFLWYGTAPALGKNQPDPAHSANFGVKLAERLEEAGVPINLFYPGASSDNFESAADYLVDQLKRPQP